MAIGGLVGSRRVARTLSWNITSLNAGQATVAATVTACLVAAASRLGLPVSTTHVACGALFGIGSVSGTAQRGTIRGILLSWCVTLPVAGVLGYALATILR
jgi:PiT family inorganic phosphate transporter